VVKADVDGVAAAALPGVGARSRRSPIESHARHTKKSTRAPRREGAQHSEIPHVALVDPRPRLYEECVAAPTLKVGARSRPQLIVSHGKKLGTSSFIPLVRFLSRDLSDGSIRIPRSGLPSITGCLPGTWVEAS